MVHFNKRPATSWRRNGSRRWLAAPVAVIMVAALALALAPAPALAATFTAADNLLHADAIIRLATLGVIRGYDDGTVRPENDITRAELAAMIARSLGLDETATAITACPRFPDVGPACQWAYGYIALASERGIIAGDPDGRFRPADGVTPDEAVGMIVRALGRDPLVEHLGSGAVGDTAEVRTARATRGDVAGYLDAAFRLSIIATGADGIVSDTGTSFLSLQKTVSADSVSDPSGTLSSVGERYFLETSTGLLAFTPGDATGPLTDSTMILLNGEIIAETPLRRALAEPNTVAVASLYMDAASGKASTFSVTTYDSQATYMQPLLAVSEDSISVPVGSETGLDSVTYAVAADAGIIRDGEWTRLSALQSGDYVSFHTDGKRTITFINAYPDADQPQLLACLAGSEPGSIIIYVDEALVPSMVTVSIDGTVCDSVRMRYREGLPFDQGRQLIVAYPAAGLGGGAPEISIAGRDHGGNQLVRTALLTGSR